MVEELAVLMHDADPAAKSGDVIAAHPRDGLAEDRDSPGDGRKLAVAEFQEGRFSRPRGAGKKVEGPGRERKSDVGQEPHPAIAMRHILELDHCLAPSAAMANMPWRGCVFSCPATKAWPESL